MQAQQKLAKWQVVSGLSTRHADLLPARFATRAQGSEDGRIF